MPLDKIGYLKPGSKHDSVTRGAVDLIKIARRDPHTEDAHPRRYGFTNHSRPRLKFAPTLGGLRVTVIAGGEFQYVFVRTTNPDATMVFLQQHWRP